MIVHEQLLPKWDLDELVNRKRRLDGSSRSEDSQLVSCSLLDSSVDQPINHRKVARSVHDAIGLYILLLLLALLEMSN